MKVNKLKLNNNNNDDDKKKLECEKFRSENTYIEENS